MPDTHRGEGIDLEVFERLGVAARTVLDFSLSVSPLGVPAAVASALANAERAAANRPSVAGDAVVRYYAERYGLDPACVLAGNGSTEMIYLVPRALGPRRVLVVTPSPADYTRAARIARAHVTWMRLSADDSFAPPPADRLRMALTDADVLVVGNPGNPTGTLFDAETILSLADAHRDKWFVVDESFGGFVDDPARATLLAADRLRPNVLVVHSLTRLFCLGGLRIGCVVSAPDMIAWLQTFKEPWSVNALAERAALALLECREHESRSAELARAERSRVFARLARLGGIRAFAPSANFVLVQWRATSNLDDLLRALVCDGFYVRDCRECAGLEDNYFCIGLRMPAENDLLVHAIERAARGISC